MDRNFLLAVALSFAVVALWSTLQSPPRHRPEAGPASTGVSRSEPGGEQPVVPAESSPALPAEPALPRVAEPVEPPLPPAGGVVIPVERPLFAAEFSTIGAGIQRWELRSYDEGPRRDQRPLALVTGQATLATPFEELGLGDLSNVLFEPVEQSGDRLVFEFSREGISIRKTYQFASEGYRFRLRIDLENRSASAVEPRFAITWPTAQQEGPDFQELALVALHNGSVERELLSGLGRGSFFGSLSGKAPTTAIDYAGEIDWAGIQTTYFLGAAFPDKPSEASARFSAIEPGKAGAVQIYFPPVRVPPGRSASREFRVYIGPKEVDRLQALGSGAVQSIDLGWSWVAPMTRFFGWLLRALHTVVPNYGLAIIILTVLVRLVTAPLMAKQMRSMERMRELQPKLKAIQEKHGDDRQKQSEETMKLYRSEGVNPLGGCLPMLLQLPVMVGLFYALRSSIQLRQAPFVAWIDDLSAPETLFVIPGLELPVRVLPLVMGVTMVIQQRMTPTTADPAQARMMMTIMPIMMTVLFYRFASGLVLYWMVGNVLAIGHQLWIRRQRAAKE